VIVVETSVRQMVEEARKNVEEITVEEAKEAWDKGEIGVVVDVREPGEWQRGHIPGALHVPRGLLEFQADPSYPAANPNLVENKDQKIVVHCAKGLRAVLAADTLKKLGYTNVSAMKGGLDDWAAHGWPVEAPPTEWR
jgi:rhodanese-related sulfurtransferase